MASVSGRKKFFTEEDDQRCYLESEVHLVCTKGILSILVDRDNQMMPSRRDVADDASLFSAEGYTKVRMNKGIRRPSLELLYDHAVHLEEGDCISFSCGQWFYVYNDLRPGETQYSLILFESKSKEDGGPLSAYKRISSDPKERIAAYYNGQYRIAQTDKGSQLLIQEDYSIVEGYGNVDIQ